MESGWESLRYVLAEAASHDIEAGAVVLEDDGDIGIDWGTDAAHVISVHVSANGRIGFAALIGDWKAHGASDAHIPDDLVIAFRKYQQSTGE